LKNDRGGIVMKNAIILLIKLEIFFVTRQLSLLVIPAFFLMIIILRRSHTELMIFVIVYCAILATGQLGGRDIKNKCFPVLAERGLLFWGGLLKILVKSLIVCVYLLIPIFYMMFFQRYFILGIVMLLILFAITYTLLCYSIALAIFLFTKEITYSDWWEWFIAILVFVLSAVYIAIVILICYLENYPLWLRVSTITLISIVFVLMGFFSFYYIANKHQRRKLK
jgi:hypothetical protein